MSQLLQDALDGKLPSHPHEVSPRVVMVPLEEWKRGLSRAVAPPRSYEAKLLSELQLGAERAGNAREVGIREDQLKTILKLIPPESEPSPEASPEPAPEAETESPGE